jgi:hypothetical protein
VKDRRLLRELGFLTVKRTSADGATDDDAEAEPAAEAATGS